MTKIFIAGIKGFIGSHLKEYVRETTDWEIVCGDDSPDYIVHLAGHSQIDESISNPSHVLHDVTTTLQLLEEAKGNRNLKKFLYFSSDEVFGPREDVEDFRPWANYNSHSPYAAGKAACEELCLAWASTFGVPTIITHCQNLFGERQPANKFLPTIVRCALKEEPVPIYSNSIIPKRNFLHVRDACSAIVLLLKMGKIRDKYNIATWFEVSNEWLVGMVANILKVEIKTEIRPAADVRPGFFVGHGIYGQKLEDMGWDRRPLEASLRETVLWMSKPENRKWIGL